MSPARRRALARRALLVPLLALGGAATVACGLALGIEDVPPVQGRPDARADVGAPEAALPDRRETASAVDAGRDAREAGHEAAAPPVGSIPARTGPQTSSTAEVNLAMRELWIGDTDKTSAFNTNPSAWTTFGYNIDGKVTGVSSTDVCTLAPNAPANVQIDGQDGRDNSFGENILDLLGILVADESKGLSGVIQAGSLTVLLDTTGLTTSPTQTNIGLTAKVFGGAKFDGSPTFTLADNWPIDPASLANNQTIAGGPKVSFSDSYITHGTWVSGSPTTFAFFIQIDGVPITLVLHEAVLSFDDTSSRDPRSPRGPSHRTGLVGPTSGSSGRRRWAVP